MGIWYFAQKRGTSFYSAQIFSSAFSSPVEARHFSSQPSSSSRGRAWGSASWSSSRRAALSPCRAVMQMGTGQRHVGHPARTAVADGGHHHILGYTQALAAVVLDGTDGDGIRGAEQRVDLPRPLRGSPLPEGVIPATQKPHPCGCGLRIYFIPLWRLHGGGGRCPPVPSD